MYIFNLTFVYTGNLIETYDLILKRFVSGKCTKNQLQEQLQYLTKLDVFAHHSKLKCKNQSSADEIFFLAKSDL